MSLYANLGKVHSAVYTAVEAMAMGLSEIEDPVDGTRMFFRPMRPRGGQHYTPPSEEDVVNARIVKKNIGAIKMGRIDNLSPECLQALDNLQHVAVEGFRREDGQWKPLEVEGFPFVFSRVKKEVDAAIAQSRDGQHDAGEQHGRGGLG